VSKYRDMKYLSFILILFLLTIDCTPVKLKEQNQPIRGVWLTNIASQALFSRENIEDAVTLCDSLGFNHIFVVTWNDATTTYPSVVMKQLTGVEIQPELKGRDPLRELIDIAHAKGIKVHAWFEFGFSCSYQKEDGGPIIEKKPHWAAKDQAGNIASKNGFQWMNAFHPEVQDFVTSLIMEVVENYVIDGIQGDDRLPALPSIAGYDDYTKELFRKENEGMLPPDDYKNYDWVKWRSAKLTTYLSTLVAKIRAVKPDVMISMAPSIYPWSEAEYLQDWPTWVQKDLVDLVIPQVYRYKIDRYQYEMDNIYKNQVHPCNHKKVIPGILLQVDNYNPSQGMLDSMIQINRSHGVSGEVFFFYEGVKKYKEYFMELYKR
jgi:uncharacterized lipoprotein YddW (UPF0748 family)